MSTPVNKEVAWDKTKTIMSKTDAKGTIECPLHRFYS